MTYCQPRPMPADFHEVAATLTRAQALRRWRCNNRRIDAWYIEAGIEPAPRKRQPPADLAEMAAKLHFCELARHYGENHKMMTRWLKALDIKPKAFVQRRKQRVAKPGKTRAPTPGEMRLASWRTRIAARDHSMEGQAAEHLRVTGYAGVYHCNERGGFDAKGKFWRAGNVVLTPDELLERARSKGWRPDAWQEVKAA